MPPAKAKPLTQTLRSGNKQLDFQVTLSSSPTFDRTDPLYTTTIDLHTDPVHHPFPYDDQDPSLFTQLERASRPAMNFPAPQQGDDAWKNENIKWMNTLPQRTFNFRLTASGTVSVSETYNQLVSIKCEANLRDLNVLRFTAKDLDQEPMDDAIAEFVFKDIENYLKVDEEWVNTDAARRQVPLNRRKRFLHDMTNLGKLRRNPNANSYDEESHYIFNGTFCRCVRLVVKNFASITAVQHFDGATFSKILEMTKVGDTEVHAFNYCQQQSRAIEAESMLSSQELAALKRTASNIEGRVVTLPGLRDRFAIRFRTSKHDSFKVPETSRAYIKAESGFFKDNKPGKAPKQPHNATNQWQGIVFLKDRQIHCSVENYLTGTQVQIFRQRAALPDSQYKFHADFEISFDEDADQAIVSRLMEANKALNYVMSHAMGTGSSMKSLQGDLEPRTPPRVDYHQYLPGLFLRRHRDKSSTRPITHNAEVLANKMASPQFQLGEASHKQAIQNVFGGDKGRTVIEGPPAIGKTTNLAKLIALLTDKQVCNLDGDIIATAHTNEAVRVLCARTLQILQQSYQISRPEEHVCLVISDSMLTFWKMSGKKLDARIEKAVIGAHLEREALKAPKDFLEFMERRRQVKTYGRSQLSRKENFAANAQSKQLLARVKKHVHIWFATLSTLHMQHPVFGFGKPGDDVVAPGIDCHVLIIDEASQATDIYVAMAILTTDPQNIVFAGDAKQLSPFHKSRDAEIAWARSLFEKVTPNSVFQRLLKQFRSQPNMYAGTTAHYDNQVWSDDNIVKRVHGENILKAIRRISFKDDAGKGPVRSLTSNIHIIDLKGTVCREESTGTLSNPNEWIGMKSLLLALRAAGVSTEDVMVLTPYQGQYDLMRADQQSLNNMAIRKIDSSQGDEAEIVVFGTVRTIPKSLGFLSNLRRQNVATSRAREAAFYFIDMDMINNNASQARSWLTWLSGLRTVNPNLVIRMKGPIVWFVDGKPVSNDIATVMRLPAMPPTK